MMASTGMIGYKEIINIMVRSKNLMGIKAIKTKNIKENEAKFRED